MNHFHNAFRLFLFTLTLLASGRLLAQGLDPATIANPPADSWPTYHGDYSGRRHSPLTQITPQNVSSLTLAWAFQTGQEATAEVFASSGKRHPVLHRAGQRLGRRRSLRTSTLAVHLSAQQGPSPRTARRCDVQRLAVLRHPGCPPRFPERQKRQSPLERRDCRVNDKGYWSSMSPLVVRDHVIVGVGGDMDNLPGFLRSVDPETGKTQWQWDSTPPLGTPNATTGGMTWMTGTYDPELNLLYWGTGNPTPVLTGKTRPGDNLYTCSIVALNPDTGKLAWAFQASPHDTHDWDAVEVPVLVDADFGGQPRKMLMQASRNGYFFVLDRTNGKNLLTVPFGPVNWSLGVDEQGQPIPNPDKEPAPGRTPDRP